ncbi:2-amino-4-hydroxy-6-hydroxymethyldihydropteridine diphosphokinase [Nitrospira sp.]|nr:2-amino-4-hydroxy-6-hydroxymethyldihydropteridine diphosphokinase [Nitrospira sp.]
MTHEIVFIGVGSNMGDRVDYCERAVTLLSLLPHSQVNGVSSLYESEPIVDRGNPGPEWFLNGVVRLETDITARSLLAVCREIESALGRDQDHRDGPRTIDLDILLYGQRLIDDVDLSIPHPRMHLRRFVLAPLAELAPDLLHPTQQRSIRDLLSESADATTVRILTPQPSTKFGLRLNSSIQHSTGSSSCA